MEVVDDAGDGAQTEEMMLQRAIALSMSTDAMDTTSIDGEDADASIGEQPPSKRSATGPLLAPLDAAIALLRVGSEAAWEIEAQLQGNAKDIGNLVKLLQNPLDKQDEEKFRKVKTTNKTIARVLGNKGVKEVLQAVGFQGDEGAEFLVMADLNAEILSHAVTKVTELYAQARELVFIHKTLPTLQQKPDGSSGGGGSSGSSGTPAWSAEAAPRTYLEAVLNMVHSAQQQDSPSTGEDEDEDGGMAMVPAAQQISEQGALALGLLHQVLHDDSLLACQQAITAAHRRFAADIVRGFIICILHQQRDAGYCDRALLSRGLQTLAQITVSGEPESLKERSDFCCDCLEALLPRDEMEEGGVMELRLRLQKSSLLASTVSELSGFSESGVRAGAFPDNR